MTSKKKVPYEMHELKFVFKIYIYVYLAVLGLSGTLVLSSSRLKDGTQAPRRAEVVATGPPEKSPKLRKLLIN